MPTALTPVLSVTLALAGCSCGVLGLGDFEIPTCSESPGDRSPCRVLDERDGIADDACEHWQCRGDAPGCVWGPRDADGDGHPDGAVCEGLVDPARLDCDDHTANRHRAHPEICDGLDNNCNDVIDEGITNLAHAGDALPWLDDASLSAPKGFSLLPITSLARAAISGEATPPVGLVGLVNRGRAWLLDLGSMQAPEIRYASQSMGTKHCPRIADRLTVDCNLRELALSGSQTALFGAAVSDDVGCADGELRIGMIADTTAPALFVGGADRLTDSNLTYGVDVSADAPCPPGVQHPRLASLRQPDGDQALVVWSARSASSEVDADGCGEPAQATELRVIAVRAERGDRPSVIGSHAGRSERLGATAGGGPAAVLALAHPEADRARYLVAFGDETGTLALQLITPWRHGSNPEGALPLSEAQRFGLPARVDYVALAAAPPDGSGNRRLAVAYRTGCGDAQQLALALFQLDDAPNSQLVLETTLQLGEPGAFLLGRRSTGPFVQYVPEGLFATITTTAPKRAAGGWIVLFGDARSGEVFATRVSLDGAVLLDGQPYQVLSQPAAAISPSGDPMSQAAYIGVQRSAAVGLSGPLLCHVPTL
ncbi:MAG: putative metal-binding motif-containing protein [Polyangiales bacterium]